VQFLRRDLLAPLDDLGPFDIICCIGTLHHLPDPAIGLSNLCDAGRPGTTLVGMVYGRFGRSVWFDVRDAFRHLAPRAATRQDALDQVAALRWGRNFGAWHYANELRSRHRFGPRVPVIESVRRVLAGRNAAYQADAFTHEVEQSFTWAELSALASSAGWTLEGWPERSGMPDRPDQLFTEPTASDVRSLSLGEQAAMYERLVRPSNLYFLATRR
jgi:SAM-dependent methyltransferase